MHKKCMMSGCRAVAAVYDRRQYSNFARSPAVIDVIDRRYSGHTRLSVQSRKEGIRPYRDELDEEETLAPVARSFLTTFPPFITNLTR